MSDTESQKLAVEIVVDEHGLEEAESRIKAKTNQHGGDRYELLAHARKYVDKREVTA